MFPVRSAWIVCAFFCLALSLLQAEDHIRQLQTAAIEQGQSDIAHWGWDAEHYMLWGTHSNRLIPVYTFGTRNAGEGIDLNSYTGNNSPYRSKKALREIYGYLPESTLNESADWMDQTNIFDIQKSGLLKGKKYIFLVVFDGMDWQTTRAASIYNLQKVAYTSGRGTGLHFQDYDANGTTQFGAMVTSPHNAGTQVDTNKQTVNNPGGSKRGGYDAARGGRRPSSSPPVAEYIVGGPKEAPVQHAYTDSAASAASMTAGIKTYNGAINVDASGVQVQTIAHLAQEKGYAVGVVTSVPISHATPACAYAHNVSRGDYQDLTRDLLGRPSISHPDQPLPGVDVLIGCGYGIERKQDAKQGENFVPGNAYLTEEDLQAVDYRNGGKYVVAIRTPGQNGRNLLHQAARTASRQDRRLFGFFGMVSVGGHLPFQTADGDYDPTIGRSKKAEKYQPADINENPNLAQMAESALMVLSAKRTPFWMMLESGDVDWANHDNNIDNSIGAVNSGDAAVKVITDWVEANSNWDESLLIVTADHGHYLVLEQPEGLIAPK